jgi:glycolate oxidase iron-sulfur subunit
MHELDKKSFLKKFLIKIFIKFPFLFKILKKNTKSDQNISKTKKETKKIIFFTGCLFDRVFQDTTENAINLFKSFGFETEVVSGQCCGLPLLSSGDEKGFKFSLEKLYEKFINIDSGVIVSGCPTCISTLKKIWPDFSNYGKELNLKFEIYDFHQFAAKIIKEKNLEFINDNNLKLKWHLPCHAKSLGAEKDCDYVLEKCFGMKPENNSRLNSCCGFGGTFSIDHPKISKKILEVRSMEIMLENEEILLTGCPACILQLERIKGYKNRVFHTIDAISSQLLAKK